MQNKEICRAAEIMEWKDLRWSKDFSYLMFLSGENVVQYNLLTDFEINYADPLVRPAGKELAAGWEQYPLTTYQIEKSTKCFLLSHWFSQDSHQYFSLLSLMSTVTPPGYIKGTATIN